MRDGHLGASADLSSAVGRDCSAQISTRGQLLSLICQVLSTPGFKACHLAPAITSKPPHSFMEYTRLRCYSTAADYLQIQYLASQSLYFHFNAL